MVYYGIPMFLPRSCHSSVMTDVPVRKAWARLSITMLSYQYRNSPYKDETVPLPSYSKVFILRTNVSSVCDDDACMSENWRDTTVKGGGGGGGGVSIKTTLQWRHNGSDSVSNHHPHDCLLNRLFRRRSKKTTKLRVTGLCVGNSPVTGEIPRTNCPWRWKCFHLMTSS